MERIYVFKSDEEANEFILSLDESINYECMVINGEFIVTVEGE